MLVVLDELIKICSVHLIMEMEAIQECEWIEILFFCILIEEVLNPHPYNVGLHILVELKMSCSFGGAGTPYILWNTFQKNELRFRPWQWQFLRGYFIIKKKMVNTTQMFCVAWLLPRHKCGNAWKMSCAFYESLVYFSAEIISLMKQKCPCRKA